MPKMNCLIFVWITLLLHLTEKVQSVRFFIIPSQDSPCPGEFTGDPCLTLREYRQYYTRNRPTGEVDVILDLQPGVHRIGMTYFMRGAKSFVMTSSTNASVICDRRLSSPLSFSSIANIRISGINFIDCQKISITSVDNLTIQNNSFQRSSLILQQANATVTSCSFTDTFTGFQTNPGAMYIEGGSATIKYSRFINNRPDAVYVDGVKSLFVSDSVFEGSKGNLYKAINIANPTDSVVVLRCNFTRNSASDGGAVSIQDGTSTDVSFTDCNFMDNHASSRGGAFYIQTTAFNARLPLNISFTGCKFMRNSAPSGGGAFYIETSMNIPPSLTISVTGCHFMENSASSGGGALFINSRSPRDTSVSLSRSSFIGNLGTGFLNSRSTFGGAVYIVSPSRLTVSLSECNFTNNTAASRGGALYLQFPNSPILMAQSYFTSNRLHTDLSNVNGGAVYILGNGNMVSVNEGAFINNTVPIGSGGALYSRGERTNFSFVDVLFLNNSATGFGGALYSAGERTNFSFVDVLFLNNSVASLGSVGGAVYVSTFRGSNVISVKGGAFVNNTSTRGSAGALGATPQQTNFSFVDVLFHNNSASYCGALTIFSDNVNITRSTFTSNRATGGMALIGVIYSGSGALCIRSSNVSVVNSTFSHNSAVGNAGVMQIERSSVEIIDSNFEHNEATHDGGVMYTKLGPITTFTIQGSTFLDNKAGDDGGVMYLGRESSRVDVNESNFSLNHAGDRGGAFVILGSTLNIAKSTFSDNAAARGDDINACISEINTDNVFEASTNSTTACISYNSLTLLPTEASMTATQTTEESATTRSMVRRTAPIIVPPQTIDSQTTAITPDYITTTDTPSRVSTTLAPQTDSGTSTMVQTDSVSTLGTTSQSGQETTTVTTNTVIESSTTLESTTTSGGEFEISTTSEQESSTASTPPQPSMATDTTTTSSSTIAESTTLAAESSTIPPERITSMASPQSEATTTTITTMMDTSTTGRQTEASTTTTMVPETEQVVHTTTTLPQAETTTSTESSPTRAETTQADTTGSVDISTTTQNITETPLTESTSIDNLVTAKTEDAMDKLPPSTDNESSITESDTVNNAAGTIVLSTGLLTISVTFAFISAL